MVIGILIFDINGVLAFVTDTVSLLNPIHEGPNRDVMDLLTHTELCNLKECEINISLIFTPLNISNTKFVLDNDFEICHFDRSFLSNHRNKNTTKIEAFNNKKTNGFIPNGNIERENTPLEQSNDKTKK